MFKSIVKIQRVVSFQSSTVIIKPMTPVAPSINKISKYPVLKVAVQSFLLEFARFQPEKYRKHPKTIVIRRPSVCFNFQRRWQQRLLRYAWKRNFLGNSLSRRFISVGVDAWNTRGCLFSVRIQWESAPAPAVCVFIPSWNTGYPRGRTSRLAGLDYSHEEARHETRFPLLSFSCSIAASRPHPQHATCQIINNTLQAAFDGRQTNSCAAARGAPRN